MVISFPEMSEHAEYTCSHGRRDAICMRKCLWSWNPPVAMQMHKELLRVWNAASWKPWNSPGHEHLDPVLKWLAVAHAIPTQGCHSDPGWKRTTSMSLKGWLFQYCDPSIVPTLLISISAPWSLLGYIPINDSPSHPKTFIFQGETIQVRRCYHRWK